MKLPLLLVLGNIFFWGLWGFFNKIAVERIGFQTGLISSLTIFVTLFIYLFFTKQLVPLKYDVNGIIFAIFVGLCAAGASILLYILLGKHPAGLVIAITGIYPVVTLILSMIFLKETLTFIQSLGFILALAALVLLNL